MGMFYGRKILKGEIRPATGKAWTMEDVPSLWRAKTQDWLDANTPKAEE